MWSPFIPGGFYGTEQTIWIPYFVSLKRQKGLQPSYIFSCCYQFFRSQLLNSRQECMDHAV